jgi:hypothetical protein
MNKHSEPAVQSCASDFLSRVRKEDQQIVNAFIERIVQLSHTFSERETACICRVSVDYIYKLQRRMELSFQDPKTRTRPQQNAVSRQLKAERMSTYIRPVQPRKPVQPEELKIPPQLETASRKAMVSRENAFYQKVCDYAQTMSFRETAKILGVTPRFLRNYCYDNEIEFEGYNHKSTAGLDLFDLPFGPQLSSPDTMSSWGNLAREMTPTAEARNTAY